MSLSLTSVMSPSGKWQKFAPYAFRHSASISLEKTHSVSMHLSFAALSNAKRNPPMPQKRSTNLIGLRSLSPVESYPFSCSQTREPNRTSDFVFWGAFGIFDRSKKNNRFKQEKHSNGTCANGVKRSWNLESVVNLGYLRFGFITVLNRGWYGFPQPFPSQ